MRTGRGKDRLRGRMEIREKRQKREELGKGTSGRKDRVRKAARIRKRK